MATKAGGWSSIAYVLGRAREVGFRRAWRTLHSRNACKTCALGMGGQRGGMVNEAGRFPEVCKKSVQAMAADLQAGIPGSFWDAHPLARMRAMSPRELETRGRLVNPLLLEPGAKGYRPIAWDDALDRITARFRAVAPEEAFFYVSGRSSNEAGFLVQLFARVFGTNHVNNCSYYCHQASGVGLSSALGTGTATVDLAGLEKADLVFVIGGNPASNHPRLMKSLAKVRRAGGRVIAINPVVEPGLVEFRIPSDPLSLLFGTKIASTWVQPDIGGDLALLTALAKRILETGDDDAEFLRERTEGADGWRARIAAADWADLEARSGVPRAQIDDVARQYAEAERVVFAWTMGITHHRHGVENVQAIANLALARGMVGREGAGLLPIRGHSNVQGIGTVGVTPRLKDAVLRSLETELGVRVPEHEGMHTMACMEAAHEGRLKLGFCLGGNLFGSNPDSGFAREALGRLDFLVQVSTTLNTGHAHGVARETIVLPALARDEEPHPSTQESMFNYVRLSDGGPARHEGPRSEIDILARIAAAVAGSGSPVDFAALAEPEGIRRLIASSVPGLERLGEIGATKEEFAIPGRVLRAPEFPTQPGRARLHAHDLPPRSGDGADELRVMTVRSEGQFNTVVYEEEDVYRGQSRRDVILVHPSDLDRLGVSPDARVRVESGTGNLVVTARAFGAIKPGNALMYYPEANVLVPRATDPASGTPGFKGFVVRVTAP